MPLFRPNTWFSFTILPEYRQFRFLFVRHRTRLKMGTNLISGPVPRLMLNPGFPRFWRGAMAAGHLLPLDPHPQNRLDSFQIPGFKFSFPGLKYFQNPLEPHRSVSRSALSPFVWIADHSSPVLSPLLPSKRSSRSYV